MINKLKTNGKLEIFKSCLYACKKVFIISLFFSLITNLMMLALPIYSLQVLDRVISSNSTDTLLMLTFVVILALICFGLVQAVRSLLLIKLSSWLDHKLSPLILSHGVSTSIVKKEINGSKFLSDFNNIKAFLTGPALTTLLDAPWSIIFIVILFFIHPITGFITLIGGIILLILAVANDKSTKPVLDSCGDLLNKSLSQADIASRNAEAIEAMGMMDNVASHWHSNHDKAQILQNKASKISAIYGALSRFIRLCLQVAVTGVGGYLVLQGQMTIGAMIAAGIIAGRALAPFEQSIISWKGFLVAKKALVRLYSALNAAVIRSEVIQTDQVKGNIKFSNVYFAPLGKQKPVLKNVSFILNPGEVLGVIGPSAAGKSTIAKLLTGVLRPNSGDVRLDNVDIYSWPRQDFGLQIGYLPQDVELFNGNILQNISRMELEPDVNEVINAAKKANVHDLILHLENGYETQIGVDGAILSAGQRQRVALARAFYGKPKVIILDEPNANLDDRGDLALVNAVNNAKNEGVGVILISHRKNILPVVDKLLYLNDGLVVAFGPKDDVLKQIQEQQTATIAKIEGKNND